MADDRPNEERALTEPADSAVSSDSPKPAGGSRIAISSAIYAVGTGISRMAGLAREILASSYFGTSGAFSAFTLAFQLPNLVRNLLADAAIQAAFVPVFTELLEQGKKRDAIRLASTLFLLILVVLGFVTTVFILIAPLVVPLLTGSEFSGELDDLTVGLSQVLFPIVILLALTGLVVGILNSYGHFTVPAFAPVLWNVVIIVLLVALKPLFEGPNELYAYAIAVLVATLAQFLMVLPALRSFGFKFELHFNLRDPRIGRVIKLLLPVTIGLGVINFDIVINSVVGSLISDQAPRAIDAAFRIYMLPQGIFSVAIATVLFPALSRLAARKDHVGIGALTANGMRQILLLLVPAAALQLALATPIVRLVFQHGAFGPESTQLVADALFWFAFSMPFAGLNLLLTRAFFSIQRPWLPTVLACVAIAVNAAVSIFTYETLGIAGPVLGTALGLAAMATLQGAALSRELGGIQAGRTVLAALVVLVSAAAAATLGYFSWSLLADLLGESLIAQIVSVGVALTLGGLLYAAAIKFSGLKEGKQAYDLAAAPFKRLRGGA